MSFENYLYLHEDYDIPWWEFSVFREETFHTVFHCEI